MTSQWVGFRTYEYVSTPGGLALPQVRGYNGVIRIPEKAPCPQGCAQLWKIYNFSTCIPSPGCPQAVSRPVNRRLGDVMERAQYHPAAIPKPTGEP